MLNDYTQNGRINILYSYYDSRTLDDKQYINTKENYVSIFKHLDLGTFQYYGKQIFALLDALKKYRIKGKKVIVWGLAGSNCEAIALWGGAEKVYVVDYNKPKCEHEKIEVMNHKELTMQEIKSAFAFSYSSFEHDGLGRYGDPLSANGDFRAMQEAHKFLDKDGILFFGVPLGQDCVSWNSHRVYGKIRLPQLLRGWQLLDVFDTNNVITPEYPFDLDLGMYIQNVLVLRKIENDYPGDEYLSAQKKSNAISVENTWAPSLYNRINRMILEYKQSL